jgi:hypothetical protein
MIKQPSSKLLKPSKLAAPGGGLKKPSNLANTKSTSKLAVPRKLMFQKDD